MEIVSTGKCCQDCLVWLANNELPPEMTEAEASTWLAEIAKRNDGLDVVVGGEHSCHDESGQTAGQRGEDCECEQFGYSTEPCEVCGSVFHGDRYAVTWFMGREMTDYAELFTGQYAVSMLWANTRGDENEDGTEDETYPEPDEGMSAFAPASQGSITKDCNAFVASNWANLKGLDPAQCGHDFALTRNGHGTGFWGRGLGDVGDRLTRASKPYGESGAWFGEDGIVHLDDEPACQPCIDANADCTH